MDADSQTLSLVLSFRRGQLEQLAIVAGDEKIPIRVGAEKRQSKVDEVPWGAGTIGAIYTILRYKAEGTDAAKVRIEGSREGSPEKSACTSFPKNEWLGGSPVGEGATVAFGREIRKAVGQSNRSGTPNVGLGFTSRILPAKDISVTNDDLPVGDETLRRLIEFVHAQWELSRKVITESKLEELRKRLFESNATKEGAERLTAPKVRQKLTRSSHGFAGAEDPAISQISAKKQRTNSKNHQPIDTSKSFLSKFRIIDEGFDKSKWILDGLQDKDGTLFGKWTLSEVLALVRHLWHYPSRISQSWGLDRTPTGNEGDLYPQIYHSLFVVEFLKAVAIAPIEQKVSSCADWWMAFANTPRESDFGFQIPIGASALATIACYGKCGSELQLRHWNTLHSKSNDSIASTNYTDLSQSNVTDAWLVVDHVAFLAAFQNRNPGAKAEFMEAGQFRNILSLPWGRTNTPASYEVWRSAHILFRLIFQEAWHCGLPIEGIFTDIFCSNNRQSRAKRLLEFAHTYCSPKPPFDADTFRTACEAAAILQMLKHISLSLAPRDKDAEQVSAECDVVLNTWAINSRSCCTETSLPNYDISTLLFLLISLLPIDAFRTLQKMHFKDIFI